jgi:hypothetical protein
MLDGSGANETGSPTCATVSVGAFSKNPGKMPTRDRSDGNDRTKPKPPGVNGSGKRGQEQDKRECFHVPILSCNFSSPVKEKTDV